MAEGKQRNKPHKGGKHASKRQLGKVAGGRISKPAGGKGASNAGKGRLARLNGAKMARRDKLEKAQRTKKEESEGAPKVVAVVPLNAAAYSACPDVHSLLADACDASATDVDNGTVLYRSSKRFRGRFCLLHGHTYESPVATLRMLAAADLVLLLTVAAEGEELIDATGSETVSLLKAAGCPAAIGLVRGLSNIAPKFRTTARGQAAAALSDVVADVRVCNIDSAADAASVVRHMSESGISKQRPNWRHKRPQVLVEGIEEVKDGGIAITGWVRVEPLGVNQLVHVPGAGDFRMARLEQLEDPDRAAKRREREHGGGGMQVEAPAQAAIRSVLPNSELQDMPRRENEDEENDEQTWPTQEELAAADEALRMKQVLRRRVPKGLDEYQAAWIPDDYDDHTFLEDEDEGNEPKGEDDHDMDVMDEGLEEEFNDDDGIDDEMDAIWRDEGEEEEEDPVLMKQKLRAERRDAVEDDLEYPDEMDAPADMRAKDRFIKYRGLKSFRSTVWDASEGHPDEYRRIFAFENFKSTANRARAASEHGLSAAEFASEADGTVLSPGSYCRLVLAEVPEEARQTMLNHFSRQRIEGPLVVVGLMIHECKMSVVHFSVRRAGNNKEPIKSKDDVLIVAGFRTFLARPVYSTDDIRADKHKYERFFHIGRPCVASMFMPICYGPLPLLMFRKNESTGGWEMVALGSFRSVDPGRITLKKIVLSGFVHKVHKNKAVVKYMFHNPDDIRWFRPLELWTKYGRRGRIKEPVGTHGAMKCIFDGVVSQRDTACISLFKRQFPPWPKEGSFGFPHK